MGAFFQIEDLLFQIGDLFFKSKTFLTWETKAVPMYKSKTTVKGPFCDIFFTFWIRFQGTSRGPTASPFAQPTLAGL